MNAVGWALGGELPETFFAALSDDDDDQVAANAYQQYQERRQ